MAYTHIAHDCQLGNDIVMSNGATLGGHVRVDDFAIIGAFPQCTSSAMSVRTLSWAA